DYYCQTWDAGIVLF
nr:immunoglobulin light chain junction region [Macaca mulatta]MOW04685.1 immunoglobulin light chain junction region [Macaca mulatta]MOW04711.1 immunoglobulin light chain junction region [Macaca mulatta]MOW04785.1 immunoglobulin light chain junction region [Macaca mulatta]MOW04830.1 immunoglobulin light chain junction region [Macaca mulatta]